MNNEIKIRIFAVVILCFIILTGSSCNDDPLTSGVNAKLYQITGCQGNDLNRSVSADSCFFYTFNSELDIEFCVKGNCCPDSNRYFLSSQIFKDTIEITVKDTARNLCKCNCRYLIRARFQNLISERYAIKCIQEESINRKVLYFEDVHRE